MARNVDVGTLAAALAVMLVGLVGTVLPGLPGLPVIWLAGLGAFWLAGFPPAAWATMAALTVLLVVGAGAKYVLAARGGPGDRVARRSLLLAAALGVVGFVLVPVAGFLVGAVLGLWLGEVGRGATGSDAGRRTWALVRRYALGMVLEVAAGTLMTGVFVVGALLA